MSHARHQDFCNVDCNCAGKLRERHRNLPRARRVAVVQTLVDGATLVATNDIVLTGAEWTDFAHDTSSATDLLSP